MRSPSYPLLYYVLGMPDGFRIPVHLLEVVHDCRFLPSALLAPLQHSGLCVGDVRGLRASVVPFNACARTCRPWIWRFRSPLWTRWRCLPPAHPAAANPGAHSPPPRDVLAFLCFKPVSYQFPRPSPVPALHKIWLTAQFCICLICCLCADFVNLSRIPSSPHEATPASLWSLLFIFSNPTTSFSKRGVPHTFLDDAQSCVGFSGCWCAAGQSFWKTVSNGSKISFLSCSCLSWDAKIFYMFPCHIFS